MKRYYGLDLGRFLCALGIVSFHFYSHSSSARKLFLIFANGTFGAVLNSFFFILSGIMLHMKYAQKDEALVKFYYKRWKAVMPTYIVVFLFAYMLNVMSSGHFFYMTIPKARLLLSFIGLDGYVSLLFSTKTYFLTGEWFIGGILIVYLCYPLLKKCMNKNPVITMALITLVYVARRELQLPIFIVPAVVGPVTSIFEFSVGMFIAGHMDRLLDRKAVIAALAAVPLLLFVRFPWPMYVSEETVAISLIILFNYCGELIGKKPKLAELCVRASKLSFPCFLIHHMIIYAVLDGWDSTSTKRSFFVLIGIYVVVLILSAVLNVVMEAVFKTRFMKFLDRLFLQDKELQTTN